jgi:hypothetical protein
VLRIPLQPAGQPGIVALQHPGHLAEHIGVPGAVVVHVSSKAQSGRAARQ